MSADDREEFQLVDAALAGDGVAFTELFNRNYSMIHAFAYRLCLSFSDADEVAQETFIKAARSLPEFRGASFRAWLYRIARNCVVDCHRARERESRLAAALAASCEVNGESHEADLEPVAAALRSLAGSFREAIVLTVCEGMSHAEAAKVTGCAEATISWRVFRAKKQLRILLGGQEG